MRRKKNDIFQSIIFSPCSKLNVFTLISFKSQKYHLKAGLNKLSAYYVYQLSYKMQSYNANLKYGLNVN